MNNIGLSHAGALIHGFFFSPNTTVLQHPWLVESEDVESREGRTKDKEG